MRGTRGFTLLGLLVVIAVINIGLGVAATSWAIINKRAKETELIWRGQQYVRALQCHRQQTGGLPDELEELLESDCIRALYPEPMHKGGEWRIIRESDLRAEAFASGARGVGADPSVAEEVIDRLTLPGGDSVGAGRRADPGGAGAGQGFRSGFGQTQTGRLRIQTETMSAMNERLRALTDRLRRGAGGARGDGIVGVASFSTDASLRIYQGESNYDAWRFVAQ